MGRTHRSPVKNMIFFFIIIALIFCVTCNSYERAGSFFAVSLPVSPSSNHFEGYTVAQILNPHTQLDFEQGMVETLETTLVCLMQNTYSLRTSGRLNGVSSLLFVLFWLFLSYQALRTLLFGFPGTHPKESCALLITHYTQQQDGKK